MVAAVRRETRRRPRPSVVVAAVRREARRRPGLSVVFAAVAAGAVIVSVFGAAPAPAEFRMPPVAVPQPSAVKVSAAAVHSGLAPYAPPGEPSADQTTRGGRTGGARDARGVPSTVPSTKAGAVSALPSASSAPAGTTPAQTSATTGSASAGTPEKAASIRIGQPGDGETVPPGVTVSGDADLPDGHQIWLLWRHGAGSYHVAGACRAGRAFTCGPAGLESGGEDGFTLTAIVVDPPTGRTLSAGDSRDALPAHAARDDVTVRRAAA
ncbi:hypothetical protein GCM10025331_35320 [Actinoplanes utahensis]|uniref:Uncharacterized protein n=1 Tax=Actinoplanes utahensis TaxID=1869 RepID=A0A0A6XF81_ACTUT|nr:hypothetical protein MB27_03790 [Actinoplanes utahensis]GIF32114.1 hypothetical protein Aut01nite_51000 [Actinoplanes utahensis]